MLAHDLPARDVADVVALLRALGGHRYVAGRMVLVHAAAFYATCDVVTADFASGLLAEGQAWARAVFADPDIDPASRDERLQRRSTEREAAAVLEALWTHEEARARLAAWMQEMELPIPDAAPFDEAAEEEIHPILIDAGWELLPLAELDATRHAGAIGAFDDPILFESARFEEADAVPPRVYLQELSAIGPAEILRGVNAQGLLDGPLTLWTEGCEVYQDYVLRGVLRAAKLA